MRDLPSQYLDLRRKLLSNASFLANLPLHILGTSPCRYLLSPKISYNFREAYLEITVDLLVSVLDSLSLPEAKFLTGWSHGKEALKDGSYDTYKGSFYVNCGEFGHASVNSQNSDVAYSAYPEVTASNVWPPEEMLPGFRQCFEELCNLIIDIAASVARACDRYALAKIPGYESGYLEKVIRTSSTTKARLLHYFPPHADDHVKQSVLEGEPRESSEELLDSWCATHVCHISIGVVS